MILFLILLGLLCFWAVSRFVEDTWKEAEEITARKFRNRLETLEERVKRLEKKKDGPT